MTDAQLNALFDDQCPRLASYREMAAALGLAEATLRRYVSDGRFDGCVKKGNPVRFHRNRAARRFLLNWRAR